MYFLCYTISMPSFLKNHWLACALSVAVGIIYVSHHIFIPRLIGSDRVYYPVTLTSPHYEEAYLYALRAHAAYQGDVIVGDIDIAENEKGPALLPLLNPHILGQLGHAFGSFKSALIVSDFIFPALIFIVLYFLMFEITARKMPSLLFSALFIFAPKLSIYIPQVTALNAREALYSFLPFLDAREPLYFSLFEEPKVTFLFFALGLYCAIRAVQRKNSASAVFGGACFGVMFYTYFYDWATFLIGVSLTVVFFFLAKKRNHVRYMLIIIGVGFLLSLFYWFNLWALWQIPHYNELIERVGYEVGRQIRFATVWKSYLRIAAIVPLLWFMWGFWAQKEKGSVLTLLTGFLLSYVVLVNAQIITGFNPQPDHWYREQFFILGVTLFLIALWTYDRYIKMRFQKIAVPILFLFLFYFFAAGLYGEFLYSAARANTYTISRVRMESYDWLRKNTPEKSVVGAVDSDSSREIQLHSHNKVFVPNGLNSTVSAREAWERYFFIGRIFQLDPDEFEQSLRNGDLFYYMFSAQYQTKEFDSSFFPEKRQKYPDALIAQKQKEYERYLARPFVFLPYQLDYLYVNKSDSHADKKGTRILPDLAKVFENEAAVIYAL